MLEGGGDWFSGLQEGSYKKKTKKNCTEERRRRKLKKSSGERESESESWKLLCSKVREASIQIFFEVLKKNLFEKSYSRPHLAIKIPKILLRPLSISPPEKNKYCLLQSMETGFKVFVWSFFFSKEGQNPRQGRHPTGPAVLQYYKVDDSGRVQRLKKECPNAECGAGTFMANHFDRHYCGKRGLTYVYQKADGD